MAFTCSCVCCNRQFKTGNSAKKHHEKCHPNREFAGGMFKDSQGQPLSNEPCAKELGGDELVAYKTWLALLTEQISGSLNPNAKAGWQQLHEIHVKKAYFQHLLFKLGSPPLHRVRDAKHYKQPIFHESTRSFSYRVYDMEMLILMLAEQDVVQFKTSAAFRHGIEVSFERFTSTNEAVDAAKRRAFSRFTSSTAQRQSPTSLSEMVVSVGKGRATRELELIWWPNMYRRNGDYGKLTVRFFVSKATFKR